MFYDINELYENFTKIKKINTVEWFFFFLYYTGTLCIASTVGRCEYLFKDGVGLYVLSFTASDVNKIIHD